MRYVRSTYGINSVWMNSRNPSARPPALLPSENVTSSWNMSFARSVFGIPTTMNSGISPSEAAQRRPPIAPELKLNSPSSMYRTGYGSPVAR